jgi:hypothetical protein
MKSKFRSELVEENQKLLNQVVNLLTGVQELKTYLTSSKFHSDSTVQASDVLRRLEEIRDNMNDGENIPCKTCFDTTLPLHFNSQCPNCFMGDRP